MQYTEEQQKDFQQIQEFVANPSNQLKANLLANQLLEVCQQNQIEWFSPSYLAKCLRLDKKDFRNKLQLLEIFNLAAAKIENEVKVYKIDLKKDTQKKILEDKIAFHLAQVEILKAKLEKL